MQIFAPLTEVYPQLLYPLTWVPFLVCCADAIMVAIYTVSTLSETDDFTTLWMFVFPSR